MKFGLWRLAYYTGFGAVFGGGVGYATTQVLRWLAPLVGVDTSNLAWVLKGTIILGIGVGFSHAVTLLWQEQASKAKAPPRKGDAV